MEISARKEQFSIAYIEAIAARLGLNPSVDRVDIDSVDLRLSADNFNVAGRVVRNPQIEIQLKCTSQDIEKDGSLKFKLPVKNYNDLRGEDITSPRYLMVLIVPSNPEEWITVNSDNMSLSYCCYWQSLRFFPETSNTSKVTVEIPTSQKITSESLLDLIEKASKREFI